MELAGYARVSGLVQRDKKTIKLQIQAIEEWAAKNDHRIVKWYLDDGVFSRIPVAERRHGSILFREARQGLFQGVVVYELDRWGRKPHVIFNALEELKELNLKFLLVNGDADLSTDDGELMFGIKASVAQFDHHKLLRTMVNGRNTVVSAEAAWVGGIIPYGYHGETRKRRRFVKPAMDPIPGYQWSEAEIIRNIFSWLALDRMTSHSIAARLNQMGVPTHCRLPDRENSKNIETIGIWRATTVRRIVANPMYKGYHSFGRQSKKREKMELIERRVPALVDEAIWQRANDQLQENKSVRQRRAYRRYLLSGKLRCTHCQCGWTGTDRPNGSVLKEGWAYVCNGRKYSNAYWGGQRPCCPNRAVREWIETVVWEKVEWVLRNPGETLDLLVSELTEQSQDIPRWTQERDDLCRTLEDLRQKGQRAETAYLANVMPLDRYQHHIAEFQKQSQEITALIEDLEARIAGFAEREDQLDAAGDILEEYQSLLDEELTWETRRGIIERLVDRVEVTPAVQPKARPRLEIFIAWHSLGDAYGVSTRGGMLHIWLPSLKMAA